MLELRITIRWRDMDAYGHVNNAVYLNYLEEVRDAFSNHVMVGIDTQDFVLAHVGIDYRTELTQSDDEVLVTCRLERIGTSSVRTREEIRKLDGTLAAEAESVMVPRDPATQRSRPITAQERAALEAEFVRDAELASG